jgi:hypothetical protein
LPLGGCRLGFKVALAVGAGLILLVGRRLGTRIRAGALPAIILRLGADALLAENLIDHIIKHFVAG